MIADECPYCRPLHHGRLAGVQHQQGCPATGRRLLRMTTAEIELFIHPDVIDLDLAMCAWYPETVGASAEWLRGH